MIEIPLTKGQVALIDDADFVLVKKYTWYALETGVERWYAATTIRRKCVLMHRLILNLTPGQEADHRDGNGCNNQRSNIRVCTQSQNMMNARKRDNATSIYKGVSWYRNYGNWRAVIFVDGRQRSLGYHETEEDAALAYNKAASELFGEFARLNAILP